jgi:tetratricopeptide (TPR) repeat protein
MEDTLEQPETSGHPCANCGRTALEGDYPTALCQGCRDHFTRLSIPLWIKLFAGGIGLIMLFSLFTFPKNIGLGIRLQRGENAILQRNYNTAEKELKRALESVPDNQEANGNLIIAAFYNQDFKTMASEVKKMASVNFEDKSLYSHISQTLEKADRYFPSDTFNVFMQAHPQGIPATDTAWSHYLAKNPEDCFALLNYANLLFEDKQYGRCDSMLRRILNVDPGYFNALAIETSVQRELGNYDASLDYARRIQAINHESAYGISTEARTLLRQKKDKLALELAAKAGKLQRNEAFVQATLILAYHFTGDAADRDALMKKAFAGAADSSDRISIQYARDVMDHKEKFRD